MRISPVLALIALAPLLARQASPCSCQDEMPCVYETVELDEGYETLWDTTVAEDIAGLEQPQVGVWRWSESTEVIEIADSGVERPAIATWTHGGGMRLTEHVEGGDGVACYGPTVALDGTLTVVDAEDDSLIISLPLTVEYQYTATLSYTGNPVYDPFEDQWPMLEPLVEGDWDTEVVTGAIRWVDAEHLFAEFNYAVQRMDTETTGSGAGSLVAEFIADALIDDLDP